MDIKLPRGTFTLVIDFETSRVIGASARPTPIETPTVRLFAFPPPNANIQSSIEEEGLFRCQSDDTLPGWVRLLSRQNMGANSIDRAPRPQSRTLLTPKIARQANADSSTHARCPGSTTPPKRPTVTPPQQARATATRKWGSPESEELLELQDQKWVLEAQLSSALQHLDEVTATSVQRKEFL